MRVWYKDSFFWRHNESSNAGDLIFNTMDKVLRDSDTSDWAVDALYSCANLLIDGKRWPNRLNQADTAKTWLQWKWYKWGLGKTVYSRPQQTMTRDPYIAFYADCIRLDHPERIREIKLPWNAFAPSTYYWRKYLISHNTVYLKCYRFLQRFSSNKHAYVKRLNELREMAIQNL